MEDYRNVNRAMWDERASVHAASVDYGFDRFVTDPEHLSDVVRFDLPLLGDVSGLRGIHLQCHIGSDTLSLHRLGASMSGLDFSADSLAQARILAERAGASIDYRHGDVYDAAQIFEAGSFDLVFTGIGALCWLPDIQRWASVVADLLKPGGRLFLREGHPVVWSLGDPRPDGVLAIEFPYFQIAEATVWDEPGTYVSTDHEFANTRSMEWNHGLGETVQALISAGIEITGLVEHTSIPWEPRPGEMTLGADNEWRMTEHPERLPLTYTLQGGPPLTAFEPISPDRLVTRLADWIDRLTPDARVRIGFDGDPTTGAGELADAVAAALDRPAIRAGTQWWWRAASLRLEYGREDVESRLADWVDTGALARELLDPLGPAGSGRFISRLRDPATDRSARDAYRTAPDRAALLIDGPFLQMAAPGLDAEVEVRVSPARLRRVLPEERQWELAAFAAYRRSTPADVVVRYDHPASPAVQGLPTR